MDTPDTGGRPQVPNSCPHLRVRHPDLTDRNWYLTFRSNHENLLKGRTKFPQGSRS